MIQVNRDAWEFKIWQPIWKGLIEGRVEAYLIVTLSATAFSCTFPPWQFKQSEVGLSLGRAPLIFPPKDLAGHPAVAVDWGPLLLQVTVFLSIIWLVFFVRRLIVFRPRA